MKKRSLKELLDALKGSRAVLLVLALGLLLLLLPRSNASTASGAATAADRAQTRSAATGDDLETSGIPYATECERLAALLSSIEGVGKAEVLLSGSGAVVVCEGAERANVRLAVTEAVALYTGLGSDRVLVMELEHNLNMREAG